jgi:membrane-bound ClpP family serine protease
LIYLTHQPALIALLFIIHRLHQCHQGVATTVLRPAGTADFEGVKLDVVTEGEFIDKGARLQVIRVEGRRIVVRSQA